MENTKWVGNCLKDFKQQGTDSECSGKCCPVVWHICTSFLEECIFCAEDEGSTFLWNAGTHLPNFMPFSVFRVSVAFVTILDQKLIHFCTYDFNINVHTSV